MFVYRMDKDTAFSSIAVDVGDAESFAATIKRCAIDERLHHPETREHRAAALLVARADTVRDVFPEVNLNGSHSSNWFLAAGVRNCVAAERLTCWLP